MTTDPIHPAAGDILFDQASAWFFRLRAPDVSAAERADFQAWLAAGPDRARAWAEVEALMDDLRRPAAQARAALVARGRYPQAAGRGHRTRRRVGLIAAACCLMVVLGLGANFGPAQIDRLRADHVTAVGERQSVTLADGSRVELNTDTALSVAMTDAGRRITLWRGEAWFDVAPDAARPFVVAAGNDEVVVLGTAFSVARRGPDVRVDVARGLVEVGAGRPRPARLRLGAGQGVELTAAGPGPVHAVDGTTVFAWRRGQLVFLDQPLAQVVAELNRYRPGRIVILDRELATRRVTGVFELDRLGAAPVAFERTLGVAATTLTPYLTLLR